MNQVMKLLLPSLVVVVVANVCQAGISPLSKPVNHFSLSLFQELVKENEGKNVFASPFSVSTALSMLLLSARGQTQQEIEQTLQMQDMTAAADGTSVHQAYQRLLQQYSNEKSSVSVANLLLTRVQQQQQHNTDNPILAKYRSDVLSLYQAQVRSVDFQADGPGILQQVNTWVLEKTHGKIKDLLSKPLSPATVAVILNAIHFQGKWQTPFEPNNSWDMEFYNNGHEAKPVVFMRQENEGYLYQETQIGSETVQVLEMPYQENNMSMLILLPRQRDGLQSILSSSTAENTAALTSAIDSLHLQRELVDIWLPKFTLETQYGLKRPLQALGMTRSFEAGVADFSALNGDTDVNVSDVVHKAFVKVDEEGTEAAAATAVIMVDRMSVVSVIKAIDFKADHPFMFLIKDNTNDLILFIGSVQSL